MKRTEAIQALRERFTNTDGTVLPPGLSIISKEEAAALGVFDDFEWKKTEMQSADPSTGMSGGYDDGWIDWGGGECPVDPKKKVSIQLRCDDVRDSDATLTAGDLVWRRFGLEGDIIAYRIHRED